VQSIHDQFANYIPASTTPLTCSDSKVFGDVTNDCSFTVADYSYCHSYIRHKSDGFESAKANKFTSLTSAQKSKLDSTKDSLTTIDDCDYMFSVLTGASVPFSEVYVRIPDHKDHQGSCLLSATVNLDDSAASFVVADLTSAFIVLTYTEASFLKNSHRHNNDVKLLSSFNSSRVHGDIIEMVRAGSTFQFQTTIEYLPTTVGLTLGTITTNRVTGIQHVTTLFRKDSHQQSQTLKQIDIGDNRKMEFSIGFIAQQSVTMKETTLRCRNPLKVSTLKMSFDNDFKMIVLNRESEFKSWFVNFFQDREQDKHSREVTVSNVKVSEGSIIVQFDVQHLQADQSALLADLGNDIKDGTLSAVYNSTTLIPKKTLFVDGKETLGDRRDEDSTWIYVVIIIVCCIVFILVTLVICLVCMKNKKRNKVMTDLAGYEMTEKQSSFDNRVMVQREQKGYGNDVDYDDAERGSIAESQATEFELVALTPMEVAASQSMAITPEGGSRPRTAERHVNDNLFFTTRPKSSGGRFNSKEEGSSNHLKLPSHHDDDGLLSPPGVVFQESRANSAMSLIDDPDAGDLNYRILEVKKQHPNNNNLFDYMGVVRVNMVGSLQEARDRFVNNESCFVGKHRFIFMNENLKYVHPKNEDSLIVKNLYQNTVLIKVLQPTEEGFSLFCPCGETATMRCPECNRRGYCSTNCVRSDKQKHQSQCFRI